LDRLLFTAATARSRPPARDGWLRSVLSPAVPDGPAEPRERAHAHGHAAREAAPDRPPEGAPDVPPEPPAPPDDPLLAPASADATEGTPSVPTPSADRPSITRERARPVAARPPPDEPLPPAAMRDHTRVRVDRDLQLDVVTHGHSVDVSLTGTAAAIDPLRTLGPELDASLVASGFALGQFSAQGDGAGTGDAPPDGEQPPAEPRATPAAPRSPGNAGRGRWRLNRYA
jgi:hypothetical protein